MKRMSKHIIRIIALFMAFALIGSALISVLAEEQKLEVVIISEETENEDYEPVPENTSGYEFISGDRDGIFVNEEQFTALARSYEITIESYKTEIEPDLFIVDELPNDCMFQAYIRTKATYSDDSKAYIEWFDPNTKASHVEFYIINKTTGEYVIGNNSEGHNGHEIAGHDDYDITKALFYTPVRLESGNSYHL